MRAHSAGNASHRGDFSIPSYWPSGSRRHLLLFVFFFFSAVSCTVLACKKTPKKQPSRGPCTRVCARRLGTVLNKQEIISSIHCCCASNSCLHRLINKQERGAGGTALPLSAANCQSARRSAGFFYPVTVNRHVCNSRICPASASFARLRIIHIDIAALTCNCHRLQTNVGSAFLLQMRNESLLQPVRTLCLSSSFGAQQHLHEGFFFFMKL